MAQNASGSGLQGEGVEGGGKGEGEGGGGEDEGGGGEGLGGGGEGLGGGGEGNGAPVCTHTFADTPDGGRHEPPPIINSDLRLWCPGITRKGLSQWQCWPDQELEWTANESELPQPEFELLSAPLQ